MKSKYNFDNAKTYANEGAIFASQQTQSSTQLATAAVSNAEVISDENPEEEQAFVAAVFNLIKACVGSGVLALSSGVAALGDTRDA